MLSKIKIQYKEWRIVLRQCPRRNQKKTRPEAQFQAPASHAVSHQRKSGRENSKKIREPENIFQTVKPTKA